MDQHLLQVIRGALEELAAIQPSAGLELQHTAPFQLIETATIVARVKNKQVVPIDRVRQIIDTIGLIEDEACRGAFLEEIVGLIPLDRLIVLRRRIAELQPSDVRSRLEQEVDTRQREGLFRWSAIGTQADDDWATIVEQLTMQGVMFDRDGILYGDVATDPFGTSGIQIGDVLGPALAVAVASLPPTDASPNGWIAICCHERTSDRGRRPYWTKLMQPSHAVSAMRTLIRSIEQWHLRSLDRPAMIEPAELMRLIEPSISNATATFTTDNVAAVYTAFWVTEQNRRLGYLDPRSLCHALDIPYSIVARGLTLLEHALLVAAASPQQLDPAIRAHSAIITRSALHDFGHENTAFALKKWSDQ